MLRKLLGLLVLFVAFYLGAHYYIRWKNTVYDDVTKLGRLVECEPNEFRKLTLSRNGQEEIELVRTDQAEPGVPAVTQVARWRWRIAKPVAGEADPDHVRRIASTICELYDPVPVRAEPSAPAQVLAGRASKIVAELQRSGSPATTVSLEFRANDAHDRSAIVSAVVGDARPRTVRIPEQLQLFASLPVEEYRNRRLMRTDADNVQQASIVIDGKERFSLERAGADWEVVVGGKDRGLGSDDAGKFVNRLSTVRAVGIEEEGFPGGKCEALRAKAVYSVRDLMGQKETVRFAYGPKTGFVTACSSVGSQRLRVHRDLIPFLEEPLKKILAR